LVRAALPATVANPDQLGPHIDRVRDLLSAYKIDLKEAAALENALFLAAREGGGDPAKLLEALKNTALQTASLGVGVRELAAAYGAAKARGAEFSESEASLAHILALITDENDNTHKALVQSGADLSANTLKVRGLAYELQQLDAAIKKRPDLRL